MQEPTEDCGSVCGGYCGLRGDTAQRENAEERKYEDEIKKDLSGDRKSTRLNSSHQ